MTTSSFGFFSKVGLRSFITTSFDPVSYGADPSGRNDSTQAIQKAIDAAIAHVVPGNFIGNLSNSGGAVVDLGGGEYLISRQLQLEGAGGLRLCCGSFLASKTFPEDEFIVGVGDIEDVTIENVAFRCGHRGGAVSTDNTLRVTLSRVFVVHFATIGIRVSKGHEVHITDSYLGEFEWGESGSGTDGKTKNMTGTAIEIDGQDHWISDIVIFYSERGIVLNGGALVLSNTHIYNGGEEALRIQGHAVRVLGCYFDFSRVVAIDPVAVDISNSMFLGGTGVEIRSSGPDAMVSGLNIVNNQFVLGDATPPGPWEAVYVNSTAGMFKTVNRTFVDGNSNPPATYGIFTGVSQTLKTTVVRETLRNTEPTSRWEFPLADKLVFPVQVAPLHITFSVEASKGFPSAVLRPIEADGTVIIESEVPFVGAVHVAVRQAE